MNKTGNTILITGGGSGIGRALAETLHARGNKVIIAGRRDGVLAEVAGVNQGIETLVLDVGDADDVRRGAAELLEQHPDLNVVIHNAGIMGTEDFRADDYDLGYAEQVITTNLLGPIRLNAALLPHLLSKEAATIITVSSGLAFVPLAITPTYSATKAAIHSWTDSLRHQLRDTNVEVIEIAPPGVATDLMPGHADNPAWMPLADFTAETMAQLDANAPENLVENVKFLRFAEREGRYAEAFAAINS